MFDNGNSLLGGEKMIYLMFDSRQPASHLEKINLGFYLTHLNKNKFWMGQEETDIF